jgi:hypothetical protein
MKLQKGERYRHYKGKEYVILGVGKHSETLEDLVIYEGQYADPEFGDHPVWVRPLAMFLERVTSDGKEMPRFTLIS